MVLAALYQHIYDAREGLMRCPELLKASERFLMAEISCRKFYIGNRQVCLGSA
jgi:hypothetical protein